MNDNYWIEGMAGDHGLHALCLRRGRRLEMHYQTNVEITYLHLAKSTVFLFMTKFVA